MGADDRQRREAGSAEPERREAQPAEPEREAESAGSPIGVPSGEPDPEPPEYGGDFAAEHTDVTFADELPGGQEGEEEPESPEGYAGLESRGVSRRRRKGR